MNKRKGQRGNDCVLACGGSEGDACGESEGDACDRTVLDACDRTQGDACGTTQQADVSLTTIPSNPTPLILQV